MAIGAPGSSREHGFLHSQGKALEAAHRDRGQERPLVFEVTIRRVRGHTDLTRHLTETEGFGADLLDEPHASINQRVPKVAMVVGRFRGSHAIMLTP